MFIIYGTKHSIWTDIWCGVGTCPQCGQTTDFHLKILKFIFTLFYIPITFVPSKRYMVCDCCEAAVLLPKEEYKRVKRDWQAKLYAGQFPPEIVLADCNPKTLKMTLKLVLLMLSCVLAVVTLGFASPLVIPAAISFARANKKHKVYKLLLQGNPLLQEKASSMTRQ